MTQTEWKSAKVLEIECAKEKCRIYKEQKLKVKLFYLWAYKYNFWRNFVKPIMASLASADKGPSIYYVSKGLGGWI